MDTETIAVIKKILFEHLDPSQFHAFIFGSRANGTDRPFSDIDIGIEGKSAVPERTLTIIKESLEESDLPYTVDIVDFNHASTKLKEVAKQKMVPLN